MDECDEGMESDIDMSSLQNCSKSVDDDVKIFCEFFIKFYQVLFYKFFKFRKCLKKAKLY